MKQFLTLSMAAVMTAGTAMAATPNMTYEQALQMQKEGKAIRMKGGLKSKAMSSGSLKSVKSHSATGVRRSVDVLGRKQMKAPQKVMANGDNIYGFLIYSTDEEAPVGVYEFATTEQPKFLWEYAGGSPSGFGYSNGQIHGYSISSFWGILLGISYESYDATTGEVVAFEEQDLSQNNSYFQSVTCDAEEEMMYGYGRYGAEGELVYMAAPMSDPFNYTVVKSIDPASGELCMSLTYNAYDDQIYGVNLNYEFVRINDNGDQEVLMQLDVPDGATYLTGLAYDPISSLFYWNINRKDESAAMATIDLKNKKLNVYQELANGEEYLSLFTTDVKINPNKPNRPFLGEDPVHFYKNSLTGYVKFVLPTEMRDGKSLEGSVDYITFIDGVQYSSASAAPGDTVRANFKVAGNGMYTFGLAAVVDGVQSTMARATTYVGNDTPLAPVDVVLNDTIVTWKKVTEGVHGGYVDKRAVKYAVSINGQELGETTDTCYKVSLPADKELTSYVASVVAKCNGMSSEPGYSNGIAVGLGLTLPQYLIPTAEEFALGTVLDANGDGTGWMLSDEGCIETDFSAPGERMDDWYFLPKMNFPDTEKFYSFSCEVRSKSATYPDEYVEVLLCNEASPRGVVMPAIVDEFSPEAEYQTVSGDFRVRQAGDYYIAIHCTSDGDQLGVMARNFSVNDFNITLDSPAAVEDFTAVPAAGGDLKATVSFTMPTMTLGEKELDADATLTAIIKGGVAEVTLTGKPGESMTADVDVERGENTLTLVVSNGEFNSPTVSTSFRSGYDVPSPVSGLEGSVSEDMLSMNLTWDAVTTGYISDDDPTGGVIDPADVTYYIVTPGASGWQPIASTTETSYTVSVEAGTPQQFAQFGVIAVNSEGEGDLWEAVYGVLGVPVALPVAEDFNDQAIAPDWTLLTLAGDPSYKLYYMDEAGTAIGLGITPSGLYSREAAQIMTPKFSTKGSSAVTISVKYSGDYQLPLTSIIADSYGVDALEIGEISNNEPGIQTASFQLPASLLGKDWVGLNILTEFVDGEGAFLVESITVDSGSSVQTFDMKGAAIAGGKNFVKVSGLEGQNVVISTLDGRVAAKASKISNNAVFNLEKGVYVVKAGKKNAKVVVK